MGLDDQVFNRLLKERIIFLGSPVMDEMANAIVVCSNAGSGRQAGVPFKHVTLLVVENVDFGLPEGRRSVAIGAHSVGREVEVRSVVAGRESSSSS